MLPLRRHLQFTVELIAAFKWKLRCRLHSGDLKDPLRSVFSHPGGRGGSSFARFFTYDWSSILRMTRPLWPKK